MSKLWSVQIDEAKFRANVTRLRSQIEAEAKAEVDKSASRFEKHVRRNVPQDSGDLASTITNKAGNPAKIERVVSIGDQSTFYVVPLEFGYSRGGQHVPGRRFWTPLKTIYNKRFKASLRRAAKRVFRMFNA